MDSEEELFDAEEVAVNNDPSPDASTSTGENSGGGGDGTSHTQGADDETQLTGLSAGTQGLPAGQGSLLPSIASESQEYLDGDNDDPGEVRFPATDTDTADMNAGDGSDTQGTNLDTPVNGTQATDLDTPAIGTATVDDNTPVIDTQNLDLETAETGDEDVDTNSMPNGSLDTADVSGSNEISMANENDGDFQYNDVQLDIGSDYNGGGDDDGDGDDPFNDDGETEESVVKQLRRAWVNERMAPELLEYKPEVVQEVMTQLQFRQKQCNEEASASITNAFLGSILQMEIDRIRYVLRDYLRTRLKKIREHARFYVNKNSLSLLSAEERVFATDFAEALDTYFHNAVLSRFPKPLRKLDDSIKGGPSMIGGPNLKKFVFCKVMEDLGDISFDEGLVVEFLKDNIYAINYVDIKDLLIEDKVCLI